MTDATIKREGDCWIVTEFSGKRYAHSTEKEAKKHQREYRLLCSLNPLTGGAVESTLETSTLLGTQELLDTGVTSNRHSDALTFIQDVLDNYWRLSDRS